MFHAPSAVRSPLPVRPRPLAPHSQPTVSSIGRHSPITAWNSAASMSNGPSSSSSSSHFVSNMNSVMNGGGSGTSSNGSPAANDVAGGGHSSSAFREVSHGMHAVTQRH